jgi:putative phosphoesterase
VDSYDVIVHGHTHEARVQRQGKTLVVNPGETCGYLTGESSIALLDTEMFEAKIVPLK